MDGNIFEFSHAAVLNKDTSENIIDYKKNMLNLFIRFNTPLNADSVNNTTVAITDKDGDIFKSSITYNASTNTIIVKPAKPYISNETYYLNVSGNIKSQGGNPLTVNVRIKFKASDDKITEYTLVKGKNVMPPSLGGTKIKNTPIKDDIKLHIVKQPKQIIKLAYSRSYLEIFFMLLSIFISVSFFIRGVILLFLFGVGLFVLSIAKYHIRSFTSYRKSQAIYNLGVREFNLKNYDKSIEFFESALEVDKNNFLAQKALDISYENLIDSYFEN